MKTRLLTSLLGLLLLSQCAPSVRSIAPLAPSAVAGSKPVDLFALAVGDTLEGFRIEAFYKDAERTRERFTAPPAPASE